MLQGKNRPVLPLVYGLFLAASIIGCSGSDDIGNSAAQEYVNKGNYEDEPESPVVANCQVGQQTCREVLDCSNNEACVSRGVTFDVDSCAEKEDRKKCENFEKRLQRVTLISDSYNFVTSPFTDQALSAEFITGLKRPWDLEFLPDGSMLVTQIGGDIISIRGGEVAKLKHDLPILYPVGTGGLLGLAVDPGFTENNFIYVVYTHAYFEELDPDHPYDRRLVNRVSRLTLRGDRLEDEVILFDRLPASLQHAGSRLEFGPDGKLYVTTGDADQDAMSQLWSFLGGKILRMNPDGTPAKDNPFPGSYVYSLGHRNPQGLAWHPDTGELYASEHGPKRYDEINRILPGRNYGWGSYRCDDRAQWGRRVPSGEYIYPLVCPKHWNLSPSGMTFVSDPGSPWYGSLFVASLRGKHLHRYVFDGDDIVIDEIFYVVDNEFLRGVRKGDSMSQRIRDVEYHAGSLYVLGDYSGLIKISPGPMRAD
jgi:glucose/arabinose dehydrogenase